MDISPMNKRETIAAIRAIGLRAVWSSEWNEWRVTDPAQPGVCYHTDDNDDALATARCILAKRAPS